MYMGIERASDDLVCDAGHLIDTLRQLVPRNMNKQLGCISYWKVQKHCYTHCRIGYQIVLIYIYIHKTYSVLGTKY